MTDSTDGLRRDVLPIPDPQWVELTTYDAKDPETTFPPIAPVRPPDGAPNVLLILIDDAGFGSSSAFGGPCSTPTFERLAADGLRYTRLNGANALQTTEFMAERIDLFGTPEAYNHYAVGWAHAMDTPYQWTKQIASHWGGTRNGTIVRWPRGIEARGEMRHQFHHVIASSQRSSRPPACRRRRPSTGSSRRRSKASRWRTPSRTATRPSGTRPSTSRCSSTAASTTRAGPP
jgi:hypothetical protein